MSAGRSLAVRPASRLLLLAALLAVVSAASLFIGAVPLSPARTLRALFAFDSGDPAVALLRQLRLPRVALSTLVGAALSISGALLQAFFQNPMAGPYVVGVSSGAGFAAVAVMTLGAGARWGHLDPVAIAAFAGGLGTVALVYALARRVSYLQSEGLLLIGIAIGAVFSALTSVLLLFSPSGAQSALFWILGSFSNADWAKTQTIALVLLLAGGASLLLGRDLNLLLWGDEVAESLGSPVRRVRAWILVLSSLLAASAVAACGVIGFVGLMVPHLARGFLKTVDHRLVLPGSALIGALLVLLADGVARSAMAPIELPVGAITSALGAPFLVFLLVRRHRRMTGS